LIARNHDDLYGLSSAAPNYFRIHIPTPKAPHMLARLLSRLNKTGLEEIEVPRHITVSATTVHRKEDRTAGDPVQFYVKGTGTGTSPINLGVWT